MGERPKILAWVILAWLFSTSAYAQTTVFLKPSEALKFLFKDSQEITKETKTFSDWQRDEFKRLTGYDTPKNEYAFYLGKTGSAIDGYAVIDDEIGKVLPITFITQLSPEGRVKAVEIMVYRESHGSEVKSRRFLNQFTAKGLNDELRLHGDIINITGATLSSRALVVGVKRDLVLWQIFYGKK